MKKLILLIMLIFCLTYLFEKYKQKSKSEDVVFPFTFIGVEDDKIGNFSQMIDIKFQFFDTLYFNHLGYKNVICSNKPSKYMLIYSYTKGDENFNMRVYKFVKKE